MNSKTPKAGWFIVDIIEPTKDQLSNYKEEITKSSSSKDKPRVFKKAIIQETSDEKEFPKNSIWMMGETPGLLINFFGEKVIMVQEKDLYARID